MQHEDVAVSLSAQRAATIMTTTHWRNAVTGDFAKAGKWNDGKPAIKDDAIIATTGADYMVKVISADAAHTLTLDSVNATLLEKAQGSLHVGTLNIEAGTAVLTTANTIGSIVMTGGELEFSTGAALGDATISLAKQAILAATASAEVSNNITLVYPQASFAVHNGSTLTLDGSLSFDTLNAETLNFVGINANGKGDGTGVVDLDSTIGAMSAHNSLVIKGVTLGTSIADNSGFDSFLSQMQSFQIETNGRLDLTHQNNVTLENFDGVGALVNTGPHEDITLNDPAFGGNITGDFDLSMDGGEVGGTMTLQPGDAIHVIDSGVILSHFDGDAPAIDLEDAGTFSGGNLRLTGLSYSGTAPTVDMGTGQNNSLTIDHTFTGIISNFGGHNGGTDHIFFDDLSGATSSTITFQYVPNESGTGGQLTVTYGGLPAFTLNLEGSYTQGDFTEGTDRNYEINCSAEQSSPHVPAHAVDALI